MIGLTGYTWVDVRVQSAGYRFDLRSLLPFMMISARVPSFIAESAVHVAKLAPRDGVAISIRKVLR